MQKFDHLIIQAKNEKAGMLVRCWMLDSGYWIYGNEPWGEIRKHPEFSIT